MSEPVVWVGEHKWPNYPTAEIDGIAVACEREKFGKVEVRAFRYDVRASHPDRDLAARAVVAAVKVLRGEQ